jgi:hypothetical protein
MAKPGSVIGWKLDRCEREQLLDRFPPLYADTIADHVTLKLNAQSESLPDPVEAKMVGHADDGDGLECMVVTINGTTGRPDDSIFHITWSLDKSKGREARESNDLLKERGWTRFGNSVPVTLEPARFP